MERRITKPLHTSNWVGFEDIFDNLFNYNYSSPDKYPPYNMVKVNENEYRVELAVAGFSEEELEVSNKTNTLTIKGESKLDVEGVESEKSPYIHKGISTRAFAKTFRLSPDVKVDGASLKNGILQIRLLRVVPEMSKSTLIPIKIE